MNETYDIKITAGCRGLGSLLWQVIGMGFNHAKFDLSVTITNSLYTKKPEDNLWDNYFLPINNLNKIDYGVQCNDYTYNLNVFNNIHNKKLWHKFYIDRIGFLPDIINDLDTFYKQYFDNKKILGVHYRSTDIYDEFIRLKQISERFNKASVIEYFDEIDTLDYDYIYLATDSNIIFDAFNKRYSNIISCATIRSDNNRGAHYIANDRTKHGKEVLLETLLMSKCYYLLHGQNNLPACVHIMNPDIKFKNLDYK